MPNNIPTRLSSLTFGATDLQRSDLTVHLDIVSGLNDGLDVRGEDTVIPSAAGRTARNRVGDVRRIILAGWIQGSGATESLRLASWQNLRDELEALFDPTAAAAELAGTALDGTGRSITARTLPGIVWTDPGVLGVEQCSVVLESTDPDWTVTGS